MSHEGHTQFLEERLGLVQLSLQNIPGLDGMRDDLRDDLIEHFMSYVEDYEGEFPILQLVVEWLVQKTADTMSSKDLDRMAKDYQKEKMPAHFRYLVEEQS